MHVTQGTQETPPVYVACIHAKNVTNVVLLLLFVWLNIPLFYAFNHCEKLINPCVGSSGCSTCQSRAREHRA